MVKQRYRQISIAVWNQMNSKIYTTHGYTTQRMKRKTHTHKTLHCSCIACIFWIHTHTHTQHKKIAVEYESYEDLCSKLNTFQRSVFFVLMCWLFFLNFASFMFGVNFWRIPYIHVYKHTIRWHNGIIVLL